jgi:dolichol-phosphate mannosyltransferase
MFPERLFMLQRPGKQGLGTAYIEGFKWALARHYQYMIEMDADFSHDPKYLGQFFDSIKEYDLVLGSRYVKGGGVVNWGFVRKLISLGGSFYSRLVLKLPFKDLTGGFKCFRRKVLEAIDLDQVESSGYSFQIEMTYRAFLKGFKIKEVPIIFADRTCGKSKMSSGIFSEAFLMVLKLRIKIDKSK